MIRSHCLEVQVRWPGWEGGGSGASCEFAHLLIAKMFPSWRMEGVGMMLDGCPGSIPVNDAAPRQFWFQVLKLHGRRT